MATLIKMEIDKLVRKKSFWIGLCVVLVFVVESYLRWVNPLGDGFYTLDKDGAMLHGRAAIRQEMEIAKQYHGILTDDVVERILQNERWNEAQTTGLINNLSSVRSVFIQPYDVNRLLGNFFLIVDTMQGGYDSMMYEYGEERLLPIGDVFPESAMPLYYEYSVPWGGTLESIISSLFLLNIFLIVGISPLFSEEHTQKMNQLLFTSGFGRRKCFWAKTAAAYILGITLALGVILLLMLATFLFFGTGGLGCSIQLVEPFLYRDYPFVKTIGAVIVDAALISIAGIFVTVSLTALVSALAKNVLNTVILSCVLFIAPVILRIFPTADWIRQTAPINRMMDFAEVFCMPDAQIGNGVVPCRYVIAGILVLISAALTLCAALIYQKKSAE